MRTQPHDVYVIKDADGGALYVGLSVNTERRLLQHRAKPWFKDATWVVIKTYRDWEEAKRAEGLTIRDLKPLHNSQREEWAAASGDATYPYWLSISGRDLNG